MKKTSNYGIMIFLLGLFAFAGCSKSENGVKQDDHGAENISVSIWTDKTELFMEYPELVVGEKNKFLIHLTNMKDFSSVKTAKLNIKFLTDGKINQTIEVVKPLREGVYTPDISFNSPGNYEMKLSINGTELTDEIVVKYLIVKAKKSENHEEEKEEPGFAFLKEQQWKMEFATELATKKEMQQSVAVTGGINALPRNFVKVISPFEGVINVNKNSNIVSPGSYVKKGEQLLVISPTANSSSSYLALKKEFLLAESEYNRAKELYEKKAIPEKRLTEAQLDYETKRASYRAIASDVELVNDNFTLGSPIDGYVEKINFSLGEKVNPGQELFVISNPSRIILKADVPETQIGAASNSKDASFIIDGIDAEFKTNELNGRKISTSSVVDILSHTVPVYFEINNPQNQIKIGMHARVFLKVGGKRNVIAVPISSIIDEDGIKTVFVQLEGEKFEKRIVKVGSDDSGYVEIISGITEGERIVTKGAYQVRLASLGNNASIGAAHVH